MSHKKALVVLSEGFEELETIAPVDILRRAGVDVVMASREENLTVTGRNGVHLSADLLLETALESDYDLVVLPGGPGHKRMREDKRVIRAVQDHAGRGVPVAAICAAPTVLKDAGLLVGRRYTAHHTVAGELPEIVEDEAVIVDGHIVTSRGAGTATEFSLALVALLFDEPTAARIAADIHYMPGKQGR